MASTTPTLAEDLAHIHKVITQALDLGIQKGNENLQNSFPSKQDKQSYGQFIQCLLAVISSHQQSEDLIAYPAFRKMLPLAPYIQFAAEHRRIEALLNLVPDLIIDISGEAPKYGLRVLVITLRKIAKIWSAHALLEDQFFSSHTIDSAMEVELQENIDCSLNKLDSGNPRQYYWITPFLLINFKSIDLATNEDEFSPVMMDELFPNFLKDKSISLRHFYRVD